MDTQTINVEHDVNIHLENKKVSRHFFIFIFLMYTFVYMTKNCFNAALADIKAEGIFTASQAGLLTAVFYIVYTPLQIVGGFVADRYSPELMIKIGLIGGAVANTVIFFNQNYYVMLVAWTLNAAVQFALWPSIYKIITSQLCRSDRSYMIFFISIAATVGLLFSYVTAAFLPSWEYNFALSAVVLLLFAVAMHLYDRYIGGYMKPDRVQSIKNDKATHTYGGSIASLFLRSGFLFLLIPVVVRSIVGQGAKTLTPLMMLDSFGTDASVGNLLTTFIIISGILGTVLVKFVLYPRIIRNELVGLIIMMSCLLLASVALLFVPNIPTMIIVLCLMSMFATASSLFVSYYNSSFTKYGKNGTAAGISNAAASFGIVILNYGIVRISELYGWQTVRLVWIAMILLAVAVTAVVMVMNARFKRSEGEKENS